MKQLKASWQSLVDRNHFYTTAACVRYVYHDFPPSHLRNFRHDHTNTVTFRGYYDETRLYKALRPRTESVMHSRSPHGTHLVLVCTLRCRIKRSHVGTIYRNIVACFELGCCVSTGCRSWLINEERVFQPYFSAKPSLTYI